MSYISDVYALVQEKNPAEKEFHQAVKEVLDTLEPVFDKFPHYQRYKILDRIGGRCYG